MKIKIKVKNIILLTFAALFIILILAPYITLQIAKYYDSKYSDKAKIFYEKYLSSAIIMDKNDALYNYAKGLASLPDKFQLMMMGWGGGSNNTLEDMDKAINALKQILEKENKNKKDLKYTILAYGKIMDIYINIQSPEDLVYWIDWGEKSDNGEINYISDLYRAFYHFANRNYTKAEEVLNKYNVDSEYVDYRYYYMKGELALWNGDIELSKKLYKEARDPINLAWNHEATLFGTRSFDYRDFWFSEYYDSTKGDLRLKGKVTFNGKPMPFVEVYLQEIGKGFRSGGGYLIGITDINGEYETLGFEPNRYEIGIGLSQAMLYDKVFQVPNKRFIDLDKDMEFDFTFVSPFKVISPEPESIVSDKFTVEWEQVMGAEYYQVHVTSFVNPLNKTGGHISFPIENESGNVKLEGTKAVFDIDKLKERSGGISWSGEERIVSPTAILSAFIPGNNYSIVVNAYDKDGNLIGSSAPLRTYYEDFPSFKIEGKLTQGEKLINEMKYEEAIDYYTNALVDDPNNKEALLYLTKIYMISYKKDKADYDKAMEYATIYDNLNDSNSLKYEVIGFMNRNAMRKYKDLIQEVFDSIPEEERNENFYYVQGIYYLSLREYNLARESFEKYESYIHPYIMYIDLYFGEIDKALELINSGNLDLYNMDKRELVKALEGIDVVAVESSDYRVIKDVIEKVLSERITNSEGKEIYSEAITKINNQYIRMLLDQIRQDNHWDMEYAD